ncbi:hypothetical protein ABEF92_008168 [Exophiala dermatitidis]
MTTLLQTALPGASPFSSSPIDSSSYPGLSSFNDSLSFGQPHDRHPYSSREYAGAYPDSSPSTAPSSPRLTHSSSSRRDSYASTPASTLSLDHRDSVDDDGDMAFPAFESSGISSKPAPSTRIPGGQGETTTSTPAVEDPLIPRKTIQDDQAIEPEPTRHVDYLSHEWKEEDIWLSWSYVTHKRNGLTNGTRLENASWRSWTKTKNRLKTVSPETLNWLKDCDVTWLYGPLQTHRSTTESVGNTSPLPSRLSHSSSFISKKPILKKKSASAVILERSRSQHSLLQRAGDIIRVQQSGPAVLGRPILRRGNSEFALPRYSDSSVANTPADHDLTGPRASFTFGEVPTPSECKHVLFDEEVRQVQAIESEEDDKSDEEDESTFEDDEDDDCGLMMAPSHRNGSSRTTPRGSFSNESKTIVPLPSTTLKYRTDTPEPPEMPKGSFGLWGNGGGKLSPSPSQETLRPPRPHQNFLIDDDPELVDEPWQPQSSLGGERSPYDDEDNGNGLHPHLRRTESGMFMPYDDEEEAIMNNTLFGQAMYAVNTFKDIAHVIWNVGWNRE